MPAAQKRLQYRIQRAFDCEETALGDVGVPFGSADAGMTQKVLDTADIGTVFQQMSRKCVAEAVDGYFLLNFCAADSFLEYFLG